MRITSNQKIAGYPAVQIRQLMRKIINGSITSRKIRLVLRCSDSEADCVLNRLQDDGFIESVGGRLGLSTCGRALAMATAASPLRRATATRLVADLVRRAKVLNADDSWAYRVGTVVVFGSYVRGVDRPSDVDVACELRPHWTADRQRAHESARREARPESFRNISEWASWPRMEVFRFLRARARGLSIHELEDWILESTDHQLVFEHEPKAGCVRMSRPCKEGLQN
jgi:nucleotidyltransferase-like protein